jgi:WD40 repeat protein
MDYTGDDRMLFSLSPPFVAAKTPPGIELWDATEGRPQARVLHTANLEDVRAVFYSAETGRLVLLSEERIWAYDTNPGSEMTRTAFHPIDNVIRSRDRRLIALQAHDRVAVVDAASGRELWRRDRIQTADLSADGRFMAAVLKDDALVVWEVASGKEVLRQAGIPHLITEQDVNDEDTIMSNVEKIVFATQSDRVALAFRKTPPRGWELPGGRELSQADAGTLAKAPADTPLRTATSADGRWKARAKDDEVTITDTVTQRDVATIRHDAAPTKPENAIQDFQFSHDGRFLLTGSEDSTVRIWDLSGQELSRIDVDAPVVAVAFDTGARHVTTVTRDGRVRTWMWRDEDLVKAVCSRLTRNLTTAEWQTHFGAQAYRLTCAGLRKPEVPPQ